MESKNKMAAALGPYVVFYLTTMAGGGTTFCTRGNISSQLRETSRLRLNITKMAAMQNCPITSKYRKNLQALLPDIMQT
jgi:hypothetical protein